ncbi:hypothetical protein AMIS_19970 [Actinoplanes missouriensis 431]|uniref:Uncharacterized protein n=1 Tax=Actinoplanes missouriensis (strain ATCC 14538 / DSM 43046 / CBS 188.64 / JCM 3121 / NBRC 102363 / NCIMB 12654 / NRRL B-3342 / UNCC 431) TaxID=512565 RepID=I0H2I0_ACTM4|nr:hypothetical protein [Actinoplanes missouriensis]BAL87217.1 hypothetical protein AMIS_19970 [Actinoplanes missouriensis 431]
MTVTDFRIPAPRQAVHDEATATPESLSLTNLRALLDDPALAGYHDDIRDSIARLQATTIEA